ncbi:hypothetical protein BDD12DRAFT_861546 [Trichophaea hybrida]|nr:hypothetical protein BDD12DRAFT_861546 [Trichophaea hybrida]
MPRPEKDSPNYAAYKAQKRADRAAKKEAESDDHAPRQDRGTSSLSVENGDGRDHSTGRLRRSPSHTRNSNSEVSDSEENSELSRRSRRKSQQPCTESPRQSPTKEGNGQRAPSPNSRNRSGSDMNIRSFGGVPFGALQSASNGPPNQQPPNQQPYLAHSQSAPIAGGYGSGYGGGQPGGYGSHNPISPIASPGYGPSQPSQPGTYVRTQGQQPLPPPSPGMYAQNPPPTTGLYGSNPNTPQSAPYPSPPLPQGGYYASVPPPPQPGSAYPSSAPAPGQQVNFTPGQGQAALQSTVPSVFHYQTGGPRIDGTTTAPYGGDPRPPPNLDPNHPGPLPGEGAGKVYPPGQVPPQYNNPDYYVPVLSDSATSQSLHHSIRVASGVSASGIPVKPNYVENNASKTSSGGGLSGKLENLSTLGIPSPGGPNIGSNGGSRPSLPPPSPALQPYHGTYQSISPMPSPTFGPSSPQFPASPSFATGRHQSHGSFSLGPPAYPQKPHQHSSSTSSQILGFHSRPSYHGESASPSYNPSFGPGGSGGKSPTFKPMGGTSPLAPPSRVSSPSPERQYNPAPDAAKLQQELKHTFTRPSPKPLIDILPTLTPSQLKALRAEYKSLYRGVNLAKHIKSVFTTSSPFGKVAFAVALGPYESEAWFANSWYQKKETRNELLIESLMGKSNKETAQIKSCFKDAKYNASLEKCVADELPANKFRIAVMAQLSCSRMEEDRPLDDAGIREDVTRLGNILERGSSGGETEMVGIIVTRSDRWLREMAAIYRQVYDRDLAKAIIKHSKNLAVCSSRPLRLVLTDKCRAKHSSMSSTVRSISLSATRSYWTKPSLLFWSTIVRIY